MIVAWTDGKKQKWRTSQIINKEKYAGLKSNTRDERILSFLIDENKELQSDDSDDENLNFDIREPLPEDIVLL